MNKIAAYAKLKDDYEQEIPLDMQPFRTLPKDRAQVSPQKGDSQSSQGGAHLKPLGWRGEGSKNVAKEGVDEATQIPPYLRL